MKVCIAAAEPAPSEAFELAVDLHSLLRDRYGADIATHVTGPPFPEVRDADLLHLICTNFEDLGVLERSVHSGAPILVTFTEVGLHKQDQTIRAEVCPRIGRMVALSEWHRLRPACILRATQVSVLRLWVPELPEPVTRSSPAEQGRQRIAILVPPSGLLDPLQATIETLAELPKSTEATVLWDPVRPPTQSFREFVLRVSRDAGVEGRAVTVPITAVSELHRHLAASTIAVVTSQYVAGTWHCLRPLAYGLPTLAPGHPVFHDAMVDGAGIRMFVEENPGHLKACLRAVYSNPIGMSEMAERGRAYAFAHRPAAFAEGLRGVYETLLHTTRRDPVRP